MFHGFLKIFWPYFPNFFFKTPKIFTYWPIPPFWPHISIAHFLKFLALKFHLWDSLGTYFFFDFNAKKLQIFCIFVFFPTLGPNETMLLLSPVQNKGTIGFRWGPSFKNNFFLVQGHSNFFAMPKTWKTENSKKKNFVKFFQVQRILIFIWPSIQAILVDTPPDLRII